MTHRPTSNTLDASYTYLDQAKERIVSKITQDLCLLSREGVCLYDLKAVAVKAKAAGLFRLAEIAELEQSDSTGGTYYMAIKTLHGVA